MTHILIVFGIIILLCIISSKLLYKFGVPSLVIFLALGMLFGKDGLGYMRFNDYDLVMNLSSVALMFIMFYGGLATNWATARPVAVQSILLSSLGTVLTAVLTGGFCYFVLRMEVFDSCLVGSVLASTDAASVFSILRSRKLSLKNNLAPLIEVESGSNDPFAYMLTIAILIVASPTQHQSPVTILFTQVVYALIIGAGFGLVTAFVLRSIQIEIEGLYPILIMGVAFVAFSLATYVDGNAYLSVYIAGIIMGNSKFKHKRSVVQFFDGVSWLMQIALFFVLGLFSFPSRIPEVLGVGVAVAMFMMLVARPVTILSILSWFKMPIKQQLFVSTVGLRGAASLVFAIFALAYNTQELVIHEDIFHIVFIVSLFSILLQGSLMPIVAKRLDLVEEDNTILKTFTDFHEDVLHNYIEYRIEEGDRWSGKTIMDIDMPDEVLIIMIRRNGSVVVPNGSTILEVGDDLTLTSNDTQILLDMAK